MIRGFANRCAEDIFHGTPSKHARKLPQQLHENARDKLDMLNAAKELKDLSIPPGNKLEALKGSYKGRHSIRINNQWRIVFRWENGNVDEVEIVDYH